MIRVAAVALRLICGIAVSHKENDKNPHHVANGVRGWAYPAEGNIPPGGR